MIGVAIVILLLFIFLQLTGLLPVLIFLLLFAWILDSQDHKQQQPPDRQKQEQKQRPSDQYYESE